MVNLVVDNLFLYCFIYDSSAAVSVRYSAIGAQNHRTTLYHLSHYRCVPVHLEILPLYLLHKYKFS